MPTGTTESSTRAWYVGVRDGGSEARFGRGTYFTSGNDMRSPVWRRVFRSNPGPRAIPGNRRRFIAMRHHYLTRTEYFFYDHAPRELEQYTWFRQPFDANGRRYYL